MTRGARRARHVGLQQHAAIVRQARFTAPPKTFFSFFFRIFWVSHRPGSDGIPDDGSHKRNKRPAKAGGASQGSAKRRRPLLEKLLENDIRREQSVLLQVDLAASLRARSHNTVISFRPRPSPSAGGWRWSG